jgi:hypothetical protein
MHSGDLNIEVEHHAGLIWFDDSMQSTLEDLPTPCFFVMVDGMKNKAAYSGSVLAAQLRAKKDWRHRQAALTFARKVEIVVCLQKLAVEIGAVTGRKPGGMVWRLTSG